MSLFASRRSLIHIAGSVASTGGPRSRFLGVGEGAQGPAAAAIANAIANATGKRLRALPFVPERVKQALA